MKFDYPVTVETQEKIDATYSYHAPFGNQTVRYEGLRYEAKKLALRIVGTTPPSREQALALTHLETAIMFANKAIALEIRPVAPTAEEIFEAALDEPDISGHPVWGRG